MSAPFVIALLGGFSLQALGVVLFVRSVLRRHRRETDALVQDLVRQGREGPTTAVSVKIQGDDPDLIRAVLRDVRSTIERIERRK